MRFFGRKQKVVVEDIIETQETIATLLHDVPRKNDVDARAIFAFVFFVILAILNLVFKKKPKGEHSVNLRALNTVNNLKEVFMAYLCAAILEPILALNAYETYDRDTIVAVVVDLFSLWSIIRWIYLITDAFSYEDICRFHIYHQDFRESYDENPKRYPWLRLVDFETDRLREIKDLSGDVSQDAALWMLLASITLAWIPGANVSHTDIIHSYVIVFLWIILHHATRKATSWGQSYFSTLFSPSTALMPLEYCLPLMDTSDFISDIECLEDFREFIYKRVGIHLIIEA